MSLYIENLSLSYDKPIFNDINFRLEDGEIACLLGRSGCGKTSILRCLLGLTTPNTGTIKLGERILFDQTISVPTHKRHLSMVFQDYALFPHLTVKENIRFGLKQDQGDSERLLTLIELSELKNRYPHELSGGQQQRVALARAIATKPRFILLDEPFSNLDMHLRQSLSIEIRALLKSEGIGAIMVTHDQNEAFAIADKIGIIIDGGLCQWDSPSQLYENPANEKVARFVGGGTILPIESHNSTHARTVIGQIFCQNLRTDSTSVIIRPTALTLTKGTHPISAKRFGDGYWIYTVAIKEHNITVYSTEDWQVGDLVAVHASKAVALS